MKAITGQSFQDSHKRQQLQESHYRTVILSVYRSAGTGHPVCIGQQLRDSHCRKARIGLPEKYYNYEYLPEIAAGLIFTKKFRLSAKKSRKFHININGIY
jgi:hypothetical protein